uniref:Uncharacterized protein n=1 Tax=Pinguiococcus pyrenoidosus TaxID=172671 RepID=A0A7R9U1H8_9STRA
MDGEVYLDKPQALLRSAHIRFYEVLETPMRTYIDQLLHAGEEDVGAGRLSLRNYRPSALRSRATQIQRVLTYKVAPALVVVVALACVIRMAFIDHTNDAILVLVIENPVIASLPLLSFFYFPVVAFIEVFALAQLLAFLDVVQGKGPSRNIRRLG